MKFDTYRELAAHTKSPQFNVDEIEDWKLVTILRQAVAQGAMVDAVKKKLFYGKDSDLLSSSNVRRDPTISFYTQAEFPNPDVVHAILGIYTEAVELLELLLDSLDNFGEIDDEKVHFETGDLMWYVALLGLDMDQVLEDNITKLKRRYPERFDPSRAIDRQYELVA